MSGPVVVILAAGQGTRMRSKMPKLLHPICGRPMIGWVVDAAKRAASSRIVVVDAPGEPLRSVLDEDVISVIQEQALGTGDAVKAALPEIGAQDTVIVAYGDVPLLSTETFEALVRAHTDAGAAVTVTTVLLEDPSGWGRVVRAADGTVAKIVETRTAGDASAEELEIREVNTGIYAFDGAALTAALALLGTDNAQGEYYLTDLPRLIGERGQLVNAYRMSDAAECFNVNDRVQLAQATAIAQRRINDELMRAGATLIDPDHTVIDVGVTLARDTLIHHGCALHGATSVGEGSVIGPHSTLIDVTVGADSKVIQSYVTGADIGDRVSVGPFAYLRPGTVLREGSKAGTFVEIKNSEVGAGSKVPHLSYIGDATIGEDTNIGASTITANYDGYAKHRTTIGSHVHTHVHTTLVAPVEIGDDSFAGAGSVITKDIPEGALGIARERQRNIEGYAERVRERHADPEQR